MLIVNCPSQDDDLLLHDKQQSTITQSKEQLSRRIKNDEKKFRHKTSSKDVRKHKDEHQQSSSIKRPVSITVKLKPDQFDLRQLIKKRRTNESNSNNHRVVQISPRNNNINVQTPIDHHQHLSRQYDNKY